METKICPNCGQLVGKDDYVCYECGQLLICPNCGRLVGKAEEVCSECGQQFYYRTEYKNQRESRQRELEKQTKTCEIAEKDLRKGIMNNFSKWESDTKIIAIIGALLFSGGLLAIVYGLLADWLVAGGGLFCSGFGCIVIGIAMLIEKTAKPKVFEDMEIYSRNLPIIVKKLEKIESEIEELKNMQAEKENNNQLT